MRQRFVATLTFVVCVAWMGQAWAVEVAPRITDREIIEALTALRSGQQHLQDQVKGLETRLSDTRQELRAQIIDFRKGLEAQIIDFRKGLEAQIVDFRKGLEAQIIDFRKGLEAQIVDTRKGLEAQIIDTRKELKDFMLWGFGVTFAGMFALVGFVIWDRRSALAPAITRLTVLEERGARLEQALQEIAQRDSNVAEALRHVGLL